MYYQYQYTSSSESFYDENTESYNSSDSESNNSLYCSLCECYVPNTKKNWKQHINGSKHIDLLCPNQVWKKIVTFFIVYYSSENVT